jgi:hypothetical protein
MLWPVSCKEYRQFSPFMVATLDKVAEWGHRVREDETLNAGFSLSESLVTTSLSIDQHAALLRVCLYLKTS